MAITFINDGVNLRLKNKMRLKTWIRRVLRHEGRSEGEITFYFTTDSKLLEMNQRYLSHDTLTDVITFQDNDGAVVGGDIAISKERVDENASLFRSNADEELRRVMIHGVLHLCGYGDKSEKEVRIMRAKEEECLAIFREMDERENEI